MSDKLWIDDVDMKPKKECDCGAKCTPNPNCHAHWCTTQQKHKNPCKEMMILEWDPKWMTIPIIKFGPAGTGKSGLTNKGDDDERDD